MIMGFNSPCYLGDTDSARQNATTLRKLRHQSALALGAMAVLVLLTGLSLWPTLLPGQTAKALLLSALVWLLVATGIWLSIHRHLPHRRLGGANLVTLARIGMVCLLVGMLADGQALSPWWPLGLASVILLLDGIDGWLARRQGLCSDFGFYFDMETDALHVLVLCLLLVVLGKVGAWVLLGGLLRYLFVGAGFVWPQLRQPLPPSLRRKTATVVLTLGLIIALAPPVAAPWSGFAAAVGVVSVCLSFLVDIIWLLRRKSV